MTTELKVLQDLTDRILPYWNCPGKDPIDLPVLDRYAADRGGMSEKGAVRFLLWVCDIFHQHSACGAFDAEDLMALEQPQLDAIAEWIREPPLRLYEAGGKWREQFEG